ncbi:hypothetical protein Nepgr_021963 [Nepenthes gracilis]|uniref:Uncharacterized protein n=1 Tax=Nepenthes gracilis TaxID=150966 RepID=A0AAD3SZT6_NEPGR|nr:hypothetical protein Nepgr_021963 [Nepenthes gracilis]
MDSYIDIPFHQQHQSQNPNSGLLRFRSAPSSLLSNFRDSLDKKYDYNQTPRLATASGEDSFWSIESKSLRVPQNGYSDSGSRTIGMQCQLPSQYPKESVVITSEAIGGSYKVDGSAMDQSTEGKTVVGSNLDRHSSSPAGLLAHLDAKTGLNVKGVIGADAALDLDLTLSGNQRVSVVH